MKKNIRLSEKDAYKLSEITGLPVEGIHQIDGLGVLNVSEAKCVLASIDWERLRKKTKLKSGQIIKLLCKEYQLTTHQVECAIYGKKRFLYYCKKCGSQISKAESNRNEGLCDDCVIESINL